MWILDRRLQLGISRAGRLKARWNCIAHCLTWQTERKSARNYACKIIWIADVCQGIHSG